MENKTKLGIHTVSDFVGFVRIVAFAIDFVFFFILYFLTHDGTANRHLEFHLLNGRNVEFILRKENDTNRHQKVTIGVSCKLFTKNHVK